MNDQNLKKKNRLALCLIFVIFLGPIIVSWWLLEYTDIVEEGRKSNHGTLIVPPHQIQNLSLLDSEQKQHDLYGKWNLVYITNVCDQTCSAYLHKLRQIHIATNKHSLRVQRVLILAQPIMQLAGFPRQRIANFDTQNIKHILEPFKLKDDDKPIDARYLYVIDPMGNLILRYDRDVESRAIFEDLMALLKNSRLG